MTRQGSIAAIAAWLVAACATVSGPEVITTANQERLHQQWELKSITVDNRPFIMHVDARMTLGFSPDGQVAGFTAVNRFSGRYTVTPEGKLVWGKPGFAATRMAGPPELMEKERAYLQALERANVAIASAAGLVLQSEDGSTALSFTRLGY